MTFTRKARIDWETGALRIIIPGWMGWAPAALVAGFLYLGITTVAAGSSKNWHFDWSTLLIGGSHVLLAGAGLLWQLAGREVVLLDGDRLVLRAETLGIGWSREFPIHEVRNLTATGQVEPGARDRTWRPANLLMTMSFQFRGKTRRFGWDLGYDEADRVSHAMQQAFSGLRPGV